MHTDMKSEGYLTDIGGLSVGHATDTAGMTGCTVIRCDTTMVGGVDVRGSATGTREIELLRPSHLIQVIHAVVLSGGSAYGLDAAAGVMRYLEEQGRGYDIAGIAVIPIVPAAILMDLGVGDPRARPDAAMGYRACHDAGPGEFARGNVGAGTGATVGKLFGMGWAMKAGLGTACLELHGGAKVGAIVAVNAFGDVRDAATGEIIAGARNPDGTGFADTERVMRGKLSTTMFSFFNTVIGLVATNVRFTKEETNQLAKMGSNGIARSITPAHTSFDGDVVFALSSAESDIAVPVSVVGSAACQAISCAILDAVRNAESADGIPSAADFGSLRD
jgi:L-aminopeptidase/D-esterase-like protein